MDHDEECYNCHRKVICCGNKSCCVVHLNNNSSKKGDKTMKTIKETLVEAGRYEQIVEILKKTIMTKQGNFPVGCYADEDGRVKRDVRGIDVRIEASQFMIAIEDNTIMDMIAEDFPNLDKYVHSTSDMLLHNYAVGIAHRKNHDENDAEKMRLWCILANLIDCMNIRDDDTEGWYVPDGWKAVTNNQ